MTIKEEVNNEVRNGNILYHVEKKLAKRLYKQIERITEKQNSYILNHGPTGSGKTNSSLIEAYFVANRTGRKIYLFFRLEDMIAFAKNNKDCIIIWDEPAFTSLSTDASTTLNKDLFRLINTARLKRHLTIINFTKFWRFNADIITETARFMINMNAKESRKGRFVHIPHKNLDKLWDDWNRYRKKNYKKHKTFGGKMPIFKDEWWEEADITVDGKPHATYQDYLDLREVAVQKIGEAKKKSAVYQRLLDLRHKVSQLPKYFKITQVDLAKALGTSPKQIREWVKLEENTPKSLENEVFEQEGGTNTSL